MKMMQQEQQLPQQQILDPLQELKNGNPLPVVATIQYYDLSTLIDPVTPLLHYLCKSYLPLESIFKNKKVQMIKNVEGKSPLYSAVEAKDINAVYWCLKQETQLNRRTIMGMTATMQCIKKGFKSGFLLCISYGHITSDLPHIAASYDDVQSLKILKTKNINLNARDSKNMTPLEVAVATYSYQSAYYLADLFWQDIDIDNLEKFTTSKVMIQNLEQIISNKKLESIYNMFKPSFIKEAFLLLVIFFLLNSFPKFINIFHLNLMIAIQFLILIIFYIPHEVPTRRIINQQLLLDVPRFPELHPICPQCIQIKQQSYQHCNICDVCIKGFHFHEGVCVSERNQCRWFFKELMWFLIARCIISYYYDISMNMFTSNFFIRFFEILTLLFNNSSFYLNDFLFYLLVLYLFIKKSLRMLEFAYMFTTGYTYQEMYHNQRYEYLYRPVKVGQHFKNKRIYIFDNGICKGMKRILGNVVAFFFLTK